MAENTYDLAADEFISECNGAFEFLLHEYGFRQSNVDRNKPNVVKLRYLKSNIAVECIFDARDDDISVKLAKLHNGILPVFYRKDEEGNVVRDYLTQLLSRRGITNIKFPEPLEDSTISKRRMRYRRALQGYAGLLKEYCQSTLLDSTDIFEAR